MYVYIYNYICIYIYNLNDVFLWSRFVLKFIFPCLQLLSQKALASWMSVWRAWSTLPAHSPDQPKTQKTNETLLVSLRGSVMKLCTSQYHVIRCVQLLCFLNFYIFWIFSRQICHIELLWTPMNSCTSLSAMAFKRPSSQLCSSFADLPTTTHMLTNHHLFCLFSRIEEHLNHFESFLFIS